MAWRESRAATRRLALLTASVSVGVAALVAINSFTENLRRSVEQQSRALTGADITLSTRTPPAPKLRALVDSIILAGGADPGRDRAEVTSFAAMAYVPRTSGTRLVRVAAVEGEYPFYGRIRTEPERAWPQLQQGRWTVVDPSLLTGLNVQVGDTLALGEARFVISGTVLSAPGDLGIRAALGPRVFIPGRYLEETRLLGFGARAEYETFIRLPPQADAAALAKRFRPPVTGLLARMETAAEDERELKSSFDQLGRYLGLVALIALLLGGIGVGSAVQVFMRQKRDTVAILRCLGGTTRQVFSVYLTQAAALGLIGSLAGGAIGVLLQLLLPRVFADFLPVDVAVSPAPQAILIGLGVGLWVAIVFALLPLLGVRRVAPLALLRRQYEESGPGHSGRDPSTWVAWLLLVASVLGLAILQVRNPRSGAIFAGGIGAALLVLWLAALALTRAIKRWFPSRLPYVWRQGLANLYRPANQTVAVVLALGFGALLLAIVALVQHDLLREFRLEAGPDHPNLVFFDIQPAQEAGVEGTLQAAGFRFQPAVPILPMRIGSVKGRPVGEIVNDTAARGEDGEPLGKWAFRREYRSTYRDSTVASEKVVVGDWWRRAAWRKRAGAEAVLPISMEVGVAGELGVTVGDTIVWDVQGVPVPSRIVNLREVNWARFEPNFFVVFPAGPLDDAPHTLVTLTRVDDPAARGRLQRRMIERFPNVTTIDLSLIQQTVERIVGSAALAIRFMALFSLITGTVVLVGAVATSRFQRIREAVLLKTLGATRPQVLRILFAEYFSLGLLAALVATGLATAAGWGLMRYLFEIRFTVPWLGLAVLAAGIVGLTVLVGLWNSAEVFRKTPLEVLRTE